jgi:SAM-dependent methyltransferase
MAADSSVQYDNIADAYSKLYPPDLTPSPFLPARLEEDQFKHVFSSPDLTLGGKRVLDLAGGNGYYSSRWLAWGAASVTSCDISDSMVSKGRAVASQRGITPSQLHFVVGDATDPHLAVPGAPFDVVTAAWLLNYAGDFATLERMWTNIGRHLAPGGVFVGLTTPPLLTDAPFERDLLAAALAADGVWGRYGTGGKVLGRTTTGFRIETRLGLGNEESEVVRFENFHIRKDVLEDSLGRTGLFGGLEWADWRVDPALRKEYPDLADDSTLLPHCRICIARRLN